MSARALDAAGARPLGGKKASSDDLGRAHRAARTPGSDPASLPACAGHGRLPRWLRHDPGACVQPGRRGPDRAGQPGGLQLQHVRRPVAARAGRPRLPLRHARTGAPLRRQLPGQPALAGHLRQRRAAGRARAGRGHARAVHDQHDHGRRRPVRSRYRARLPAPRRGFRPDAGCLGRAERPLPDAAAARPVQRTRHRGPRRRLLHQSAQPVLHHAGRADRSVRVPAA